MTSRDLLLALLLAYAGYAAVKPFFFFLLPYEKRRRLLDGQYAGRPAATQISDNFFLLLILAITLLLYLTGIDHVSFLAGLLVGMTIIQLFFHRFTNEPNAGREAPKPMSPIKRMSYAIQDRPALAWRELLLIIILPVGSIAALLREI